MLYASMHSYNILHVYFDDYSLGTVPVMESSVVIAVSSPHRVDSIAAVQYCIENLKGNVPIWKKEVYMDQEQWKENVECSWSTK
jgi:molybdopterin synthase catalytic subunit